MEVKGTVYSIREIEKFQSGIEKQTIIVKVGEQYPQFLPIDFLNKSIACLSGINVGDNIDVSINLQGREWTSNKQETKYIVSIKGWKINKQQQPQQQYQQQQQQYQQQQQQYQQQPQQQYQQQPQNNSFIDNNNGGDLPF